MIQLSTLTRWRSAPPRLYLHSRSGVREPPPGRGRHYWVVARELCRFFRVPLLQGAAVKQQLDALALQTKRLSSFAETGSHYHFGPDFISLWIWDQGLERDAADTVGVDIDRLRVLPETALKPEGDDGVRLVATLDGVEGQSWIDGALAASRLWPAPPDDRAWVMFQRGASVAPDRITAVPPEPMELDWLDRPWTRSRASSQFDLAQVNLPMVAAGIGTAFLIAYAYLGVEWIRVERDIAGVRAQAMARTQAAAPEVEARAKALKTVAEIEALRKLDPYPTQLWVMSHVSDIMPQNDTHFTEWNYDRGKLQISVAAGQRLDAIYFVRALQNNKAFKNVEAERASDDNSLRIRLAVDTK